MILDCSYEHVEQTQPMEPDMAGLNFDATTVEPNQPFEVLPAGTYKVQMVDSDMRPTKDGNGQYLWCEFEILEGECQGRKTWDRLNLVNQNQQAVEIAQRSLSALCHAAGRLHVADSQELHFVPVMATIRVRPAKGEYGASNEIRGYSAVNGSAPAPMSRPAAPAAAAPATSTTAPWKQRRA